MITNREDSDMVLKGDLNEQIRTIIVKRMAMNFNDMQASVINFTDISAYKRLQKELEVNNLLKTLNATVHHEMIVPLNVNLDMATRLKKCLKNFPHELKLVDTMLISSNIVLLHAHDLLDQRLIEEGTFVPMFTEGDTVVAIDEII